MTLAVQLTEANKLRIECTRTLRTITESKNAIKEGKKYIDPKSTSGLTWAMRLESTQARFDEEIIKLNKKEVKLELPVTKLKEMKVTVKSILKHLADGGAGRPSRPEHDKVRDLIFKGRLKAEILKVEVSHESEKDPAEVTFGRPKNTAIKKLNKELDKIATNVSLLHKMVGATIEVKKVVKPKLEVVAETQVEEQTEVVSGQALSREEKDAMHTGSMDALLAEESGEEVPKKRKPGRKPSAKKAVVEVKAPVVVKVTEAPKEVDIPQETKPLVGIAAAAETGQMPIDLIQPDIEAVVEPKAEIAASIKAPVTQSSGLAELQHKYDELNALHQALKFEYNELTQTYLSQIQRETERMTRKAQHMAGEI